MPFTHVMLVSAHKGLQVLWNISDCIPSALPPKEHFGSSDIPAHQSLRA